MPHIVCWEMEEGDEGPTSAKPQGRADAPWEHFHGAGAAIRAGRFAGSHLSPSFWGCPGHFCCHQKLSHPWLLASQCSSSISVFRDRRGITKHMASHRNCKTLTLSDRRAFAQASCSAFHTSRGSGEVRDGKCVHLEGKKSKRR